jgi:hypothetical protein
MTTTASCTSTGSGAYSTPAFNTGTYASFTTFAASSITLPAGPSVLRICMDTASYLIFGSFSMTLQSKQQLLCLLQYSN